MHQKPKAVSSAPQKIQIKIFKIDKNGDVQSWKIAKSVKIFDKKFPRRNNRDFGEEGENLSENNSELL